MDLLQTFWQFLGTENATQISLVTLVKRRMRPIFVLVLCRRDPLRGVQGVKNGGHAPRGGRGDGFTAAHGKFGIVL